MDFSFFIINQTPAGSSMKQTYDEGLEQIEWGDRLGYDTVFLAEHAFYHHGKTVTARAAGQYRGADQTDSPGHGGQRPAVA